MSKARFALSFSLVALVAMVVLVFPLADLEARLCCLKPEAPASLQQHGQNCNSDYHSSIRMHNAGGNRH